MKSILVSLGVVGLLAVFVVMWWVSTSNREVGVRNLFVAKQRDNMSAYDATTKKIVNSSRVTTMQAKAVMEVVKAYAEGRGSGGGSLFKSVMEAIPNLDQNTYVVLMNIVNASLDGFSKRQTELLDLKRAHDDLRTKFPSSLICGSRPELEAKIVTSTRVEEAFATGKDDQDLIPDVNATPEK